MARPKPSSAANGRLSQGPITEAGKNRSRFNAVTHGLTAKKAILLEGEDMEHFKRIYSGLRCTFTPDNEAEDATVDAIIADEWRRHRARSLQTELVNDALREAGPEDKPFLVVADAMGTKEFAALVRYETALGNDMDRAIRRLVYIRKNFPEAAAYEEAEEVVQEPVQPEPQPVKVPEPQPRKMPAVATATATATAPNPVEEDRRPDQQNYESNLNLHFLYGSLRQKKVAQALSPAKVNPAPNPYSRPRPDA